MSFTPGQTGLDHRLMLIGDHRVFYYGLLGKPAVRNVGCATLYVAEQAPLEVDLGEGWQLQHLAWVPPYVPHRIRSRDRHLAVVMVEPEYTDTDRTGAGIRDCLAADADALRAGVLKGVDCLQRAVAQNRLSDGEFDDLLFGQSLPRRSLDDRVSRAVDHICKHTAEPCGAADLAQLEGLSLSRFLHLFKAETGVCLRKYRAWRRARSLLYHVRSTATLTDIALETGYPDSTHFSHSIRRIYGLPPRDIVSGSRRLRVSFQGPAVGVAASAPTASARKLPNRRAAMV